MAETRKPGSIEAKVLEALTDKDGWRWLHTEISTAAGRTEALAAIRRVLDDEATVKALTDRYFEAAMKRLVAQPSVQVMAPKPKRRARRGVNGPKRLTRHKD